MSSLGEMWKPKFNGIDNFIESIVWFPFYHQMKLHLGAIQGQFHILSRGTKSKQCSIVVFHNLPQLCLDIMDVVMFPIVS